MVAATAEEGVATAEARSRVRAGYASVGSIRFAMAFQPSAKTVWMC